jgi:thiol-disulfide isomerase/thioredoxin
VNRGVVIALAIAIAAALGFFAQRQLQPTAPTATAIAEPAAPTSGPDSSAPDAAATPAEPELKIPEVLPHFELTNRDGKKQGLKAWAGQPLMVNYWATWCGPCRREIPLLNEVRKQRAAQRVEIIGIAVDFRDDVLKYAVENPISYPLLIGEEDGLEAVKAMGMQAAFPFTVFADSKQRVVALRVGELHQDTIDFILDRVIAVDAGKLELKAAQSQITEGLKELDTQRKATEAAERAAKPKSG